MNLKLFLLMLVYAWMEFSLLISGIWSLNCSILLPTNSRSPKREYRETCCVTHHQACTPTSKPRIQFSTMILNCAMSIMFLHTWSLLNSVRCSTSLKTMSRDQDEHWRQKSNKETWIQNPQSSTLTGFLKELNLDPKIQIKYVHCDEWNNLLHLCNISHFRVSFLLLRISALPAAQKRWRKGCNKDTEKK